MVRGPHRPSYRVLISAFVGKRILTADVEGTLIFWDPRSPTPLWKLTPEDGRFDLDGITSLAANSASTVAVIGGAAGGIRVVNLGKGDIVGALAAHKEGESVEAIAFVGFAGTAEVVVTGSTDGKVCVWDLNTLKVRNELEHGVSPVFPLPLRWSLADEPSGTCYMLGPTSITKVALGCLGVGRQRSQNMGHPHWCIGQRTSGSPWTCAWFRYRV